MLPELYHAHHNRHLEDIPFWLNFADQTGGPVLELGCGTGRVLIRLAQAGFRCVGLDRDLGMLRYLAASLDRSPQLSPRLIAADISRFRLGEQFPLIILPCNTFSTLTAKQRQESLRCIRSHLSPGGIFAVSLPNPELWRQLPAWSDVEYEEEFALPRSGNPVQVSSSWQRGRRTFTVTWIYDQLFPNGTVERVVMEVVHYRVPFTTYADEIRAADMKIISTYGDFDRSPLGADSPNWIILATPDAVSLSNSS